MAAVASAADQATDLIQKLSLEPKANGNDAQEATKKVGSVNNGDVPNALVPPYERSITPLLQDYMDGGMCYLPNGYPSTTYYYGGYDGSINEWEDYSRYMNTDGVELPPPGVYGDMYHHGYGYAPYGPYPSPGSPVPTLGHDGQLYGPQHYQFPAPYYQPPAPVNAPHNANQVPTSKDLSTSNAADQPPISTETTKSNSYGTAKGNTNSNNGSAKPKPTLQNSSFTSNGSFVRGASPGGLPASGYQDPRFGFDGLWSPFPWVDGPLFPDGQQRPVTTTTVSSNASQANVTSKPSQNGRSLPHLMGIPSQRPTSGMGSATPGVINRMYSNNRIYGQNTNAYRNGFGFGSNFYDSRYSGRWVAPVDNKFKNRVRSNGFFGYGNEKLDGLTELNRGPRADRFRSQKSLGQTVTLAVKGQSLPIAVNVQNSSTPDKDQYNKQDFPDTYVDAKFFIIKSYSEDDVHKSVKYNVWASTANGNKKLDAAYQEAQQKTSGCPVFLFFSVNTSGQFVGVAEMVGPVDFNKTLEYWQQDKWTGCFPVKWHIVKDVPNGTLKHITLENNDNKPVTNSRDTQEVKLEQGLQMLKIFKEHSSKTSILDDFEFYENRQTIMQEKRTKQHIQKKVVELKPVSADEKDRDLANGKPRSEAPVELVTVLKKEHGENGVAAMAALSLKEAKTALEKRVTANGISNGL